MTSLVRKFTIGKTYLNRSMTYIAPINAGMLGFLLLDKLVERGVIHAVHWYAYPIIFFSTIGLCMLLGHFEQRIGLHQEEIKIQMENNPQLNEVLEIVKRLEKKNNE